jgi:hypothetical protein
MGLRQGDQPIQALATDGPDNAFADRIRHRAAWRRFQHGDSGPSDRFVEVFGENAIAMVKQIFVSLFAIDRFT